MGGDASPSKAPVSGLTLRRYLLRPRRPCPSLRSLLEQSCGHPLTPRTTRLRAGWMIAFPVRGQRDAGDLIPPHLQLRRHQREYLPGWGFEEGKRSPRSAAFFRRCRWLAGPGGRRGAAPVQTGRTEGMGIAAAPRRSVETRCHPAFFARQACGAKMFRSAPTQTSGDQSCSCTACVATSRLSRAGVWVPSFNHFARSRGANGREYR